MNYIAVVNTINRPKHLVERCLNALLAQKISPIKVILIDQNEKELEVYKLITDNPILTRSKVNLKSVSSARNSVVIPEGADWIFFCDDDGFPCEDFSVNNLINIREFLVLFELWIKFICK